MAEIVYASSTSITKDSSAPRYIVIKDKTYVVYSLDEDKKVLQMFTENRFLHKELENCDSLVLTKAHTIDLLENKLSLQNKQLNTYKELTAIVIADRDKISKTLEDNNRKAKRRSTTNKVLLSIGIVFTLGLILLTALKK
jgi:hypothetical protein